MRRALSLVRFAIALSFVGGCALTPRDIQTQILEKVTYSSPSKIDASAHLYYVPAPAGLGISVEQTGAVEPAMCEFFGRVFTKVSCGRAAGSEDLLLTWRWELMKGKVPDRANVFAIVEVTESKTRETLYSAEYALGQAMYSAFAARVMSDSAELLVLESSGRGKLARWLENKRRIAGRLPSQVSPSPQASPPPEPRAPVAPMPVGSLNLGRYHALIVGNQAYRNLPRLQTPVADAQALAALLRDDYKFASVNLLTDATRIDMIRALDDLRRTLTEHDNLLIYYAGHGYLDREADRGYWLPIDAESDNTGNWLSNADIVDKLRALRAKHALVVADSCFSGTLVRDVTIRPLSAPDISRLAQKRARTAITSGGLEPVSDVGGAGNSVFARAFLEALRSVDGVTDMTTLFATIRRQVLLNSQQTPQYSDVRQAGHDGGDFLFMRRR